MPDEEQTGDQPHRSTPPILVAGIEHGLVDTLQDLCFSVERTENGLGALEAFDRGRYDLVLIDCDDLLELDGFDVAKAIRLRERGERRTPVIGIALTVTAVGLGHAKAAGMDDLIALPILQGNLTELLEKWLGTSDRLANKVEREGPPTLDPEIFERTRANLKQAGVFDYCVDLLLHPDWLEGATVESKAANPTELVQAAHKLKGTALQFGAFRMSRVCAQLEAKALAEATLDLRACFRALRAEIARLEEHLSAFDENP